MIELTVHDRPARIDAPGDMPVWWALRDVLGLTGHDDPLRHSEPNLRSDT